MSHYEDEAEVEQLKRWWSENWKALFTGLALGLAGILGWQTWHKHKLEVAGQASQMYEELRKAAAATQLEQAESLGRKLMQAYADSPYAAQAALVLAQLELAKGKADDAARNLAWAAEHSADEGLRHVATLRQARVLWQQSKPDDALKLLDEKDAGSFASLYAELRGDIKLSQGDRAAAAAAYRQALEQAPADTAVRSALQQKLDDLADVKAAS